jgi:hypothetical protein
MSIEKVCKMGDWMRFKGSGVVAIENPITKVVAVMLMRSSILAGVSDMLMRYERCKGEYVGLVDWNSQDAGIEHCDVRVLESGIEGDDAMLKYKMLCSYWQDEYRKNGWTLYKELTPYALRIKEQVLVYKGKWKIAYYACTDRKGRDGWYHYVGVFDKYGDEAQGFIDTYYTGMRMTVHGLVYGGDVAIVKDINQGLENAKIARMLRVKHYKQEGLDTLRRVLMSDGEYEQSVIMVDGEELGVDKKE